MKVIGSVCLMVLGGVAFLLLYFEARDVWADVSRKFVARTVEDDLSGKEIIVDLRSQRKTSAPNMTKQDVLNAYWVCELQKYQAENQLVQIRELARFDPYVNFQEE